MKRKILLITCSLLLTLSLTTSAFAAESSIISATNKTPKAHTFKSAWGETIKKTSATGSKHRFDYGYDTTLINEDYAYADSNGYQHRSKIVNGNGTYYGPKKWANDGYSNKEVRHGGSTVKYYCNIFK